MASTTVDLTVVTPQDATSSEDELVRSHLSLVGHLVRELAARLPGHVNRDELVSAGMLALAMSARTFCPARGVPFARYAAIRIRGALTDELRSMDWASRSVRSGAREIERIREQLQSTLGRTPTRREIAASLGVAEREVEAVQADVDRASTVSLQALTADAGFDIAPVSGPGPEGVLLKREQLGYLRDAIAELPPRLQAVVEQYFFAQRRMADIAADLGVTESRVSQLRGEALALLRDGLRTAADGGAEPTDTGRAAAARRTYVRAVAGRSTVTSRLAATTLLGEPVAATA